MDKKGMDRNLIYNRNEKRVSDNYAKENLSGEDATKYGEFVSTFHKWLPVEKQKEQADEMENMTKDKKNK